MTRPPAAAQRLTVIVAGYIIGYPLGGMSWHCLNYLLGLQAMGHEVWFLEDSSDWCVPYNPLTQRHDPDPSYGIDYLRAAHAQFGLPQRWCYYSQHLDRHYGLTREELHALMRRADLAIYISGITPLRPDAPRPRRTVVIDTDPVLTQLNLLRSPAMLEYYRDFDRCATFGALLGTSRSPLPTAGLEWVPTRQPVHLPAWPETPVPGGGAYRTIGAWGYGDKRSVTFEGRTYRSHKGDAWETLLHLPDRLAGTPARLGIALAGLSDDARARFAAAGWEVADAAAVSESPMTYAEWIRASAGEFTVAKEIYASLPSGWFSDRSACFLASGRPVVTQATGFEHWLPTGEGLFAFSTPDEAAAALATAAADPARHGRAARALAEQHFDARRVLGELIDHVM